MTDYMAVAEDALDRLDRDELIVTIERVLAKRTPDEESVIRAALGPIADVEDAAPVKTIKEEQRAAEAGLYEMLAAQSAAHRAREEARGKISHGTSKDLPKFDPREWAVSLSPKPRPKVTAPISEDLPSRNSSENGTDGKRS